jgi:NADPH:quinone reductase-like Zn-dependent oxidoreductase
MQGVKMKAVVANGYGGPEVLQFQEVQVPDVQDNEVLVEVFAASATRADSMMRTGKPYFARLMTGFSKPKHPIPGTGFAGRVKEVGEKVKNFQAGDRVFGETTLGFSTNAEFVAIPEKGVMLRIPDNLSYMEAASFCDGYLTSLNFLKYIAKIQSGQKILINGASGSLGTAAVQIAKYYGAIVTGVSSGRNMGLVESLGADYTIDYTQEDFTEGNEKYDVIYDTIGKSSFHRSKKVLTENGLYLSPVLSFSLLLNMLWTGRFSRKQAKFAATGLSSDEDLLRMLEEVVILFKEGKLKTIIDRQYPLEKTADAHAYIDKGRKKGNVIIAIRA